MNPPIQPTAEQREAAKEMLGYVVMRVCPHRSDMTCLCGEIVEEDATRILARLLSSREALAAYSASQEVLRSVEGSLGRTVKHGVSYPGLEDAVIAARLACEKFPKP